MSDGEELLDDVELLWWRECLVRFERVGVRLFRPLVPLEVVGLRRDLVRLVPLLALNADLMVSASAFCWALVKGVLAVAEASTSPSSELHWELC